MRNDALTPKQRAFIDEYLVDLNATQAAIRAGYSAKTANREGTRLLSNAVIAQAITDAKAQRAESTGITAELVVQRLAAIATADPRELVEFRRNCCRHCYGDGFRYQYTDDEWRRVQERRQRIDDDETRIAQAKKAQADQARDDYDDTPKWSGVNWAHEHDNGGTGFTPHRMPNPACPRCAGDGVERVRIADTRKLSPAAAILYAGIRETRHGIEVKMHDQLAALQLLGKHLGLFVDKVEHTGKDGAPIAVAGVALDDLPDDQLAALAQTLATNAAK